MFVNLISKNWEPKQLTIGSFQTFNITGAIMVLQLQQLLAQFSLVQRVLAYVKDEGTTLQTCAFALNSVIFYNCLGVFKPVDRACLGHALSKVCQYASCNY
jgi:hypothetical protein